MVDKDRAIDQCLQDAESTYLSSNHRGDGEMPEQKQKSFLAELVELIERHRRKPNTEQAASVDPGWLRRTARWFIPNGGTVLLVIALIATARVWARPLAEPVADLDRSATTVNYQGHLADAAGNPKNDTFSMQFALYDDPEAGNLIWGPEEHGAVEVSDGLFSVGLGGKTIGGIPTSIWNGNRYLEITVDDEVLSPREVIRSVPIAGMALSVPEGSIAFGGRSNSYPYVVHLHNFGLWQTSYCRGYVPGDPGALSEYPECDAYPGLNRFTEGFNTIAYSGSGHIRSANNMPYLTVDFDNQKVNRLPTWGYAYTFFLHNAGNVRDFELPISTCNDVAIYTSTGDVMSNKLGTSASLAYHRFPGNANEDLGCPCDSINPTIQLPAGDFRVTLLTRGASCTSYLNLGELTDQGPVGNWIQEAGLDIDWPSLRTYLGEY